MAVLLALEAAVRKARSDLTLALPAFAPWVAPCQIKASECATKKSRSGVQSRKDQRTRTQLPLLPALLHAVERQRKDAEARIGPRDAMVAASSRRGA